MGKQCHALEDHSDVARAHLAQLSGSQPGNLSSFDHDLAKARFDQAIEQADER